MTEVKTEGKAKVRKPRARKLEALTPLPPEEPAPIVAVTEKIPEGEVVVPKEFKTKLTRAQIDVIKEQFAKGASDVELQMFLYVCARTGLDPFSKQIHLVPRYDGKLRKDVFGVVVGIDGLRSIAERTGLYAGNSDPVFDGEHEIEYKVKAYGNDGRVQSEKAEKMTVPTRATVTVKKAVAGVLGEFTASVDWTEYYPGDKQGFMWRKMPKVMLGKCAEAKALRKAFPAVMSGLYVPEELHQSQRAGDGAQVAPQGDYDRAQGMIAKTTNAEGLEAMKAAIKTSDKYTADQKETLLFLMDQRIAELKKGTTPAPKEAEGTVM